MTRYVRAATVVARRIAGEMVLVPVATRSENPMTRVADFFVLNTSGEFLWNLLASPREPSDLARLLMTEYGITLEQAKADVSAFLDEMLANGALDMDEAD
jgi:hypothetical protein